jgi:F-type H+-transporting ATPase subunit c
VFDLDDWEFETGVNSSMKILKLFCLVMVALLLTAAPALAQTGPSSITFSGAAVGAGLGAGITIIGAGWGFGRIGAAALESMARQPEIAGRIQTAMIVIAALLEGATFFALIVCILMPGKAQF